jgi:iron complex outermembrane recepter protein
MMRVQLGFLVSLGAIAVSLPAQAEVEKPAISPEPLLLHEVDRPATTVKEWMAQVEAATVQVTNVRLERTEAGLDIILETAEGKPLQVDASKFRAEGNNLVADIPNAVLALPQGQTFGVENPTTDIATVQVVQQDAASIRVSVAGKEALPKTEVTLKTGGLAYSLNPEGEEAEEEVVVTGEGQRGYRVPNASTATKTDTPIRDIPASIQVVPQEVIRDQQITRQEEALRNVPGVITGSPPYYEGSFFRIRGFLVESFSGNNLLNGLPDFVGTLSTGFSNVERVEVLKGPASVLFGQGSPGGTINTITKQPLREPFYEISTIIGNNNFYQGAIDLSGPLDRRSSVLYRLNTSYRNAGSSIDGIKNKNLQVAPVISWSISDKTKLTLEGDYVNDNVPPPTGIPALGSVLFNPNGKILSSRNYNERNAEQQVNLGNIGFRLEHKFSDRWSVKNAFLASFYDLKVSDLASPAGLQADNRTLNRQFFDTTRNITSYLISSDITGRFSTGSVEHQLVVGFSLNRYYNRDTGTGKTGAPIDIFNPVFGQPIDSTPLFTFASVTRRTALGIYIQDQIAITKNLKLLLGLRFDTFSQTLEDQEAGTEQSQSENAFSPRVGIVYQPISSVSLYASYSQSFSPVDGRSFENIQFQPQRGTQYEIGVKADLSDKLSATLAFYDLSLSNVLTTDPANPDFSIQTGKQRSRGIETNLSGEILPGWNILLGYAYTDARIVEDNALPAGNQLDNVPEHSLNLWTTYEIQTGRMKGLGFGLGLFYTGERQGDLENSFKLPSYLRTDAAIFYKQKGWKVSLNVRNLFGIEYFESSFNQNRLFAGEAFTIQGGVSYQF